MADVRTIISEVRSKVDAMRNVTSDVVSRMSGGAETMFLAADEFSKAGQGISGVLQEVTGISNKLADASSSVSASSTMLQGVVDYAMTRETLAAMLADLRSTVENAKREANLTSDISSDQFRLTEARSGPKGRGGLLAGISNVLETAYTEFATGLSNTVRDGHREFYQRLSNATSLLRQAIEELASTVEPAMPRA